MKLKGIWIAIGVILVGGIGATSYTKSYISAERERTAAVSQSMEETMAGLSAFSEGVSSESVGIVGSMAKVKVQENVVGESQGQENDSDQKNQEESVLLQLRAIDEEIAQRASSETDTTPNARKAAIESEWKLWETQMNRFLDTLENQLEPSAWEKLFKEQKEWLRTRDEDATKGSGRQNGSTLDEIEYNRLIRESTRQRTYELAERYGEILSASE
ncbi:lysozyme inhibitor LprI family protein [Brotaphodocola sp.]|uniref:lysozyme inhibitor LprI family protein n=1 Tax=Brotaphodocola sp. TaxID=3073577 RepID=UPI003D7D9355